MDVVDNLRPLCRSFAFSDNADREKAAKDAPLFDDDQIRSMLQNNEVTYQDINQIRNYFFRKVINIEQT